MKHGQVPKYRNGECSRCGKPNSKVEHETYCDECRAIKQSEYRARIRAKLELLKTLLARESTQTGVTLPETQE
jgi:hypothetical protein